MYQPALSLGSEERVYITSVISPKNFFCQLTKSSAELDNLMTEIEEHYRPLGDHERSYTNPREGEACCAMFTEDDGWYRAVVTKVTGSTVGVTYLDYGNSEVIPMSRVKVLSSKFTVLAAQGFNASLSVTSNVDVSSFKESVIEKEFMAKIVKSKDIGGYEVELSGLDGARLFTTAGKNKQGGKVLFIESL